LPTASRERSILELIEPATAPQPASVLEIDGLSVDYRVRGRPRRVLDQVSLRIGPAGSYGLVGESGCGKSTAALAAVRYLPRNGLVSGGRIVIDGRDVMELPPPELRRLRAKTVSMVYQDPSRALNPSIKIGRQIAEVYEALKIGRADAHDRSAEMLRRVRIADPLKVMQRYPHQLSGGMQQRVCIAMALAVNPKLLILDEPTTGLDVTVEAEVLDLIRQLRNDFQTAILFISHNLAVVANLCDRVGVLYAGTIVEEGSASDIFRDPRHPYTIGLLRCLPARGGRKSAGALQTIPGELPMPGAALAGCVFAPRCPLAEPACRAEKPPLLRLDHARLTRCIHRSPVLPAHGASAVSGEVRSAGAPELILSVQNLSKTFTWKGHDLQALRDITLSLARGETLGLVGESGSGKTTLARVLLGLTDPDPGARIELDRTPLASRLRSRSLQAVKALQIVFQNPDSALNRSHTVQRIIRRVIGKLAGQSGPAAEDRLRELARAVRLPERHLAVRPRQLSGGLKQRVAIARAFAGDPRIVVCDEPTSALDVSVQAAILNLLVELQSKSQVSYIFISHDLGVIRYLADRIAVLYRGRLLEIGPAEQIFAGPQHPYTERLLSAIPSIDRNETRRIRPVGEAAGSAEAQTGCVFHNRCLRKLGAICEQQEPTLQPAGPRHSIRCHIPAAELSRLQASSLAADLGQARATEA
jgi:peptide/nickel transport system ATP-binding protein